MHEGERRCAARDEAHEEREHRSGDHAEEQAEREPGADHDVSELAGADWQVCAVEQRRQPDELLHVAERALGRLHGGAEGCEALALPLLDARGGDVRVEAPLDPDGLLALKHEQVAEEDDHRHRHRDHQRAHARVEAGREQPGRAGGRSRATRSGRHLHVPRRRALPRHGHAQLERVAGPRGSQIADLPGARQLRRDM